MSELVPMVEGVDYDATLRGRLVEWLGTPVELRGAAVSLPEFAASEGVTVSAVTRLIRSDAGIKDALRSVALGGLFRVPRILEVLGNAAETGSIRAAEIYLDFIRKTLTDQQLMAAMRPSDSFEDMVGDAVKGAQMLLEKAKGRKVTVGVQLETNVSVSDGFRARSELSVREGMPSGTPSKDDIDVSTFDGRVSTDSKVSVLRPAEGNLSRREQARENMRTWEERNSSNVDDGVSVEDPESPGSPTG
jgi:hypothetical protein